MKTKWQISAFLLAGALACSPAITWSQQPYPGEENHQAKQDMRNAGHETKDAVQDTGRGMKHGTQKAYHSTKRHARHAKNKVKNTVNGAREGARQPQ